MKSPTLAQIASLMLAVQCLPLVNAATICSRDSTACGCPGQPPCPPAPPEPSPPPPPPPASTLVSTYIGPAQGVLGTTKSLWQSSDAPDDPVPVSTTRVEFRNDVPARAPGTLLSLSLDAGHSWASITTGLNLALQMGGHTLRLTNNGQPDGTNALSVLSGQTRLLNGTVQANEGDLRIGGNSSASLVLDGGAQVLMSGPKLRSVRVGTGDFGADGLLQVTGGSVLRTDIVILGSFVAAASGHLTASGAGSLLDLSQLTVGGTANGANGTALVNNGATVRTQGITVGGSAGATGELTVDGANSLLGLRGGAVSVGTASTGLLTISGGAALLGEDATVISLGNGNLSQSSVLRVQGAGSRMSNVGIQVLPSGTLEVRDGAHWDAGPDGTGVNALAVQAGTVRFSGAQVTLATATVTGLISEGSDFDNRPVLNIIKTGQWDIGNGSTVAVNSLVSIDSASQLRVHDTGTTFSFTDMVLNGFLSVSNGAEVTGGLIGLGKTGQIGGNLGRIHADVMGTDGRITPGNSPGRLTIDGNVTLGGQASLELDIAGTNAGINYDVLAVSGNLQMSGGRLVLKFLDGFAPQAGDVFNLLQVGGTLALDASTPVDVQGLQAG